MGFIFNVVKHHFSDTIKILNQYKALQKKESDVIKLLHKIGKNQFDVYKGNLTTKEILLCYKKQKTHTYGNFEYFFAKDHSLWIVKKIIKNHQIKLHIHPARNTFIQNIDSNKELPMHIRIHSSLYKILLMFYWNFIINYPIDNSQDIFIYINSIDTFSTINSIRENLNLPKISPKQFDKENIYNLFYKFFNK